MRPRRCRLFTVAALPVVVALALSAPAQAGVLVSSATSCSTEVFSQPFLPWADVASYVPAPGGTFEAGATPWTLSHGAAVVPGNESHFVTSATDSSSLALPGGSSATSPSMCVGIDHPDLRLFVRNAGWITSTLKVEVLFEDAFGNLHSAPLAAVIAGGGWQPTLPIPLVVNLLPLLPNDRTAVAFRFTPQGSGGDWQIDDVYVDPWSRG